MLRVSNPGANKNPKTTPRHQGFQTRARFAHVFTHVSPTFRPRFGMGPFFRWLGPWHNSLEFTAVGMEFKDFRQFQAIFSDFRRPKLYNPGDSGTAAWTSRALSA